MDYYGLCTKAGGLVSGTDISKELISKGKIKLVILATDCSENTSKEFNYICDKYNTKLISFGTIEGLSKAIGKNNRAVIALKNKNLAEEIFKIICGGDTIG